MTADPRNATHFTIEEYLRLEADAAERHEFLDGRVVAMAGGTAEHTLITSNLIGEVRNRVKGKPCRVYDGNLRVRIPHITLYTCPDLSVACGDAQFDPNDRNRTTVINPRVVVEVSSASSEGIERLEKFRQCLSLDSLHEYVLASQVPPFVQTFFRRGDGTWLMTPALGLDAALRLHSLDVDVPLVAAYTGTTFPPEPGAADDGTLRPV